MNPAEQLLLNVRPRADFHLEDFAGTAFGPLLAACQALLAGPAEPCFIAGADGCGRAALLEAVCAEADRRQLQAVLLDLAELQALGPELLAGLEDRPLLILDSLEAVAGERAWEEALFHLYNRARAGQGRLLFAAREPLRGLPIGLPDLRSRLQQATAYALPQPDDTIRQQLLVAGVARRGLPLSSEVQRFLLERGPRSLDVFLACLEQIDKRSLRDHRRLTLPFVREVLSGVDGAAEAVAGNAGNSSLKP